MIEIDIEIEVLATSGPVRLVLEDVPVDGCCCTWDDDRLVSRIFDVLPLEDGGLHITTREMREEVDRAINQKL